MPIVLGLDLSQTRTGWAVLRHGSHAVYGHLEWPEWKNDKPRWLAEFHAQLAHWIKSYEVTHIFYEETFLPTPRKVIGKRGKPIFKPSESFNTRFAQLALVAVTQMTAHENNCDVQVARIRDWRERYIGTSQSPPSFGPGPASTKWFKDQAVTASNLLGWMCHDHNEAEALGIAHYGMCCVDPRYTENTQPHTNRMRKRFVELMRGER